ncbi:sn-glycerol-3-phosphate transport system permease protein UgpA [Nocardia sp. RB56]|uniref:sn-glycerol-3-phosphate transport system permease protein UgpA n=1 Tax=Nocardia aurantia TaxID=2585199 RepID=A0A7K0DPY3_9NOCA|nr:sn-glycerol-3-phosphate transport system permease protein UgpA [Nocardia aurantia]
MTATGFFVEVPATQALPHEGRALSVRPARWRRVLRAAPPYLYLLPALACVIFWTYRPLAQTVQLSFYHWDMLPTSAARPAGLDNYRRLLTSPALGRSLWLTVVFILGMVPFTIIVPTFVGLVTRRLRGRTAALYRALVFAPMLVPPVAGAVVWQWLLDPRYGAVDRLLGIDLNWLQRTGPAQLAIIVITGWHVLGFACLIVTAGIAGINDDYTEAAALDGASRGQTTRWITLPLLSPTLLFLALMTILLSAQWSFPVIDNLTQGGPSGATTNIYYFLWETAFQGFAAGSAAAAGVLFFLGFGVLALVLVRLSDRFGVHDN